MYQIITSNKFLKDLKLLNKRSPKDAVLLKKILEVLEQSGVTGLDKKHKAHKLVGNYKGLWECT